MADTNQGQLSFVEESTFGTTPASALTDLRITGETFQHNISNIKSNEVRADRQVTDLVQADAQAEGGYSFELSYGTPPDGLLEGIMFTTFGESALDVGVAFSGTLSHVSFAAGDNSINDSDSGFVTAGVRIGQWLRVSGSAAVDNNTWHKVLTAAAGKIVCSNDTTITTDDGVGDTIKIKGTVNWSGATISAGAANGVYTFSAGNPLTEGIRIGMWVEIRGFTGDTSNNGYKFVTAVDATTFTTLQTTVSDAEGETVTVKGNHIWNGDILHSYTIQRELEDAVQFFAFHGQVPSSMDLNVSAGAIITGTLNFLGGKIATTDLKQTTFGTGANVAAPSSTPMTAIANVAQVMEGSPLADIAADVYVQSITLNANNNLRGKKAIGTLGNVGVGAGEFNVTGTMNILFDNDTFYDKFLAGSPTGISFKVEDSSGNAYIFTMPYIKFITDDGGKISGMNADIVETISFQALYSATYGYTMAIDKFPA